MDETVLYSVDAYDGTAHLSAPGSECRDAVFSTFVTSPTSFYTSSTKLEKYRGDALRRYILNFAADTTRRSKSFAANHKSQHRRIPKVHTNCTCFSKMFSGLRSQCIRRLWNSASKQCSIEWANLRTRCREKPRNLFRFVTYSNSIAAGKIASENKQQFYYCFVL